MKPKILPACWSAACLALILGLGWVPPVQASTFGGRAFAAFVNTLATGPVYLSDSGELAPNGGWASAGLLGVEVPGVLSAHVLNASTSGAEYEAGDKAHSSSSLAEVVLLPGHHIQVTASFVRARVSATTMGSGGAPEIGDLAVGGFPVTVTGRPNQTVQIPGVGTLIINEQAVTTDGVFHEITLNALHLTLVTGEEVILASVRSSVYPAGQVILPPPTPPADLPPAGPTLQVSATSVAPGTAVTVTLEGGPGGSTDWLALAAVGAQDTSYAAWTYVGTGVTTRTWTVTVEAGSWEFRLFRDNGFARVATSPTVATSSNSLPTASTLSPAGAASGGGDFTLTVNGSNFVAGSVVRWKGLDRVTTYMNATQLTAAISMADIAAAGPAAVTVFNPAPGGGTSNALTFTVATGPTLQVSATSVAPGTAVTVTLAAGPGGSTTWLALAAVGAPNTSYAAWTYVGTGVTTRTWTVTVGAGSWEFRLFRDNGFTRVATSPTVATSGNPLPTASTLSPASAAPGGGDFTLTVNGGNFVAGSVVRWKGLDRVTTYVNATQLSAAISMAVIAPPPPLSPPPPSPGLPSPVLPGPLSAPAPIPTNIAPLHMVGSLNIKHGQLHSGSKNGHIVEDWNSAKSQGDCPSQTDQVRTVVWGSTEQSPVIMASHRNRCFPFDFVTGGGQFQPRAPGGPPKRVSFNFEAGFDKDDDRKGGPRLEGHFNLVDRNDGTRIKSVNVDSYVELSADPGHCRVFGGNAKVTGPVSGTFRYLVGVCDYGGSRRAEDDDDDDGERGQDDRIRVLVCSSSRPCNDITDVAQGDVYFADNQDPGKPCPADKPLCGDLDRGDIQLRKSKCNNPRPTASRQGRETVLLEV